MDAANTFINAGIFVATVIAAIIAWRSVADAQRARDEAKQYETDALAHAETAASAASRTADASQRAAEALEEANRREKERDNARIKWLVERAGTGRWRVRNNTGTRAHRVAFLATNKESIRVDESDGRVNAIENGDFVHISFGGGFGDPSTARVRVHWTDGSGRAYEAFVTLG